MISTIGKMLVCSKPPIKDVIRFDPLVFLTTQDQGVTKKGRLRFRSMPDMIRDQRRF